MMDETMALTAIIGILQAANFWYLSTVSGKITKLSNGCFQRHIDLAKKEGQNEMMLEALHERTDRIEGREVRANARDVVANARDKYANERERE
jgi:hypothetical protein